MAAEVKRAVAHIESAGIAAIIRGTYALPHLVEIGLALSEGGVTVLEVTLNSTNALPAIAELRRILPSEVLVGAGTVLTSQQVDEAINAGAQFLVAPGLDELCVEHAHNHGTLFIPGVFTASEIGRALKYGCHLLKLFPASQVGHRYLQAIRGPFPDARFLPTGGVGLVQIEPWLRAGASALGVGSSLVKSDNPQPDELTELARDLVGEVQRVRDDLDSSRS